MVSYVWSKTGAKVEDWLFLGILGIIMSFVSYGMDWVIEMLGHSRIYLYRELGDKIFLSYLAWKVPSIHLRRRTQVKGS